MPVIRNEEIYNEPTEITSGIKDQLIKLDYNRELFYETTITADHYQYYRIVKKYGIDRDYSMDDKTDLFTKENARIMVMFGVVEVGIIVSYKCLKVSYNYLSQFTPYTTNCLEIVTKSKEEAPLSKNNQYFKNYYIGFIIVKKNSGINKKCIVKYHAMPYITSKKISNNDNNNIETYIGDLETEAIKLCQSAMGYEQQYQRGRDYIIGILGQTLDLDWLFTNSIGSEQKIAQNQYSLNNHEKYVIFGESGKEYKSPDSIAELYTQRELNSDKINSGRSQVYSAVIVERIEDFIAWFYEYKIFLNTIFGNSYQMDSTNVEEFFKEIFQQY